MRDLESILLVELPTFPKGTVALSLYAVAAAFGDARPVRVWDLNLRGLEDLPAGEDYALIGLKVSAQNFHLAVEVNAKLRRRYPEAVLVWGGEYATLVPGECAAHADAVVSGAFEPVAGELLADLEAGELKGLYVGGNAEAVGELRPPRLDLLEGERESLYFMGLPLETSRGCTYKCTFCLVHQMQPGYALKDLSQLQRELPTYAGRFINLIDYNFGVEPAHVIRTARAIRDSEALGWMAEMCLESLDNDDMLAALAESRCRMIYCGLESIDEDALRAVNKARTNQISNYTRIIRKVQSYGIHVAAGVIIGLPEARRIGQDGISAFERTRRFFQSVGIAYAKLTFLTYNPGTKVRESMRRKGDYLSESPAYQDGNHLSYLAHGLEAEALYRDAEGFIRKFYQPVGILRRVRKGSPNFWNRLEMFLFNLCYRDVYVSWLERDVFRDENAFQHLLREPLRKGWLLKKAEQALYWVRRRRYKLETGRKAPAMATIPQPPHLPSPTAAPSTTPEASPLPIPVQQP